MRKNKARLGMFGYARVLGSLVRTPMSRPAMAQANLAKRTGASRLLSAFLHHRFIHVSGWDRPSGRGMFLPVYAFGDRADAPPPPHPHFPATVRAPDPGSDLAMFCELVLKLRDEPMTTREITEHLGLSARPVRLCLAELRRHGLLFIADWEPRTQRNGGAPIPIYAFGTCKSKPRPEPLSRKVHNKAQWQFRKRRLFFAPLVAAISAPAMA